MLHCDRHGQVTLVRVFPPCLYSFFYFIRVGTRKHGGGGGGSSVPCFAYIAL